MVNKNKYYLLLLTIMVKLQIAVSEEEHKRIYYVLNKALASFQMAEGKKYTYRSTIVKIVEEWATNNGFIEEIDQKDK